MKNKGITLVALVITIIILLILAGITISSLTGENGLFRKIRLAKEKTEYENAKEIINMKITETTINSESIGKEVSLNDIEKVVAEANDTTVDKIYFSETGTIQNSIGDKELDGIVVSADNYSKYKFLIGKTYRMEKVILSDKFTETVDMNDSNFIDIEKFETEFIRTRIIFKSRINI